MEDNILHRKALVTGILLLFIGGVLSPVTFGLNVDESNSETYTDDLAYVYSPIEDTTKTTRDYQRVTQQYQAVNDLSTYIQEPPTSTLVGPIDSAWPMASHDSHHTGLSPYNTASNPGHEMWRFTTRGAADTGIAIDADGTLYFGDFSGWLYALNSDGTLKWEDEVFGYITTSTPCIAEDGTIYIGGYYGLAAYNPDGSRKWKIGIGGNVASAPAVDDDGIIYVGHHDNEIVAVYPNGTIKWKYATGFDVVSSPAIADDGTIVIGSGDHYLYALNPNGTLKWRYLTQGDVKGSPSIDDNGIIYVASWGDYLHAIYPNGTMKWKFDLEKGSETTPCFGPDGTIYVSYEKLWAINPDGSLKWIFNYLDDYEDTTLSNPAISADGIIYIGTRIYEVKGGHIYALNPDGTLRWRKMIADENVHSSPSIGEDGTVYIGSWWDYGGRIHAFKEWSGSNNPPSKPILSGKNRVREGYDYRLDFVSTDPENHTIAYIIDWGDGTIDEFPYDYSGIQNYMYNTWYETGSVTIRVKARDTIGAESDWSYKEIEVPYTYNYAGGQRFLQRFPLLNELLSKILFQSD
jgi:outer membrane protein assembly factor BamB